MSTAAPAWFTTALDAPRAELTTDVAGRRIAYSAWGDPEAPPVVLVHGGAAHRHWWDHVAPAWAAHARVLALDLSGHGDSDAADAYSLDRWADEVVAVLRAGGAEYGALVGHSMGGHVALRAAARYPAVVTHLATIDTFLRTTREWEEDWEGSGYEPRPHRVYASRDEAVPRFRLLPAPEQVPDYVLRHVAEHSLSRVEGGWRWHFDPASFDAGRVVLDELGPLDTEVTLVRGQRGLSSRARLEEVAALLGPRTQVLEIPGSGHHVPLEAPESLVRTLGPVLKGWAGDLADRTTDRAVRA